MPWRLEGPEGFETVDGASLVVTNSSEVARELYLAGLGIALRSTWDVGEELRDGRLVQVLAAYEGARDVAVFAARLPGPATPAAQAFIAFVQELYAAPSWEGST